MHDGGPFPNCCGFRLLGCSTTALGFSTSKDATHFRPCEHFSARFVTGLRGCITDKPKDTLSIVADPGTRRPGEIATVAYNPLSHALSELIRTALWNPHCTWSALLVFLNSVRSLRFILLIGATKTQLKLGRTGSVRSRRTSVPCATCMVRRRV